MKPLCLPSCTSADATACLPVHSIFSLLFRKSQLLAELSGPKWGDLPDTKSPVCYVPPPLSPDARLRAPGVMIGLSLPRGLCPRCPSLNHSAPFLSSRPRFPRPLLRVSYAPAAAAPGIATNAHSQAPWHACLIRDSGDGGSQVHWLTEPPFLPWFPRGWWPHLSPSLVPRTRQAAQQELSKYLWDGLLNVFSRSRQAGTTLCIKRSKQHGSALKNLQWSGKGLFSCSVVHTMTDACDSPNEGP